MYKETIVIIIIIILIFIGNSITQNYTKNTIEVMQNELINIKEKLDKEEFEEAKQDIEKVLEIWEDKNKKLSYYLEHDELEKVGVELTALKEDIFSNNYEQTTEHLAKSYFYVEHMEEKEAMKLNNIF